MMSSSSQSFVALNIMAMAWQWSLTALLNRSMLPSPRRLPRPDGSEEGISTSAAQSAVSSQQSAVSSQQSVRTSDKREQCGHGEVPECDVRFRLDVREAEGPERVHVLEGLLIPDDSVRADREQVPVALVSYLVRPVALDGHAPGASPVDGWHDVAHDEALASENYSLFDAAC